MPYLLNLLYLFLLLAISPWLVYKAFTAGKYRQGLFAKLFGLIHVKPKDRPRVWFHAVSVGEVLLLREVVARFRRRHPDYEVVISTTTNTGFAVARERFPDIEVFYWPLDFTWAVNRALAAIRPDLVVLAELELWPNFIRAAKRRRCGIAIINGRLSKRSYQGYRRIRGLLASTLKHVDLCAVQTTTYAKRFQRIGFTPESVHVTGSVKYDGVPTQRDNPQSAELACQLHLPIADSRQPSADLVWVVGSTQAPEETIALDIYRKALSTLPGLRLVIVPRHAERFDEVAALIQAEGFPLLRRSMTSVSTNHPIDPLPVILLDTLGELGAAWGLADLAYVGGSLSQRGGQNMIEPAAYGVAVTFGPHVWNFQDTVDRLREHHAAVQVRTAEELEKHTLRLLGDPLARARLGQAAQQFVLSQQGATERTLDLLDRLLTDQVAARRAA
jgi:3-deoxy-D-manno-octulosonic-acid transferase